MMTELPIIYINLTLILGYQFMNLLVGFDYSFATLHILNQRLICCVYITFLPRTFFFGYSSL